MFKLSFRSAHGLIFFLLLVLGVVGGIRLRNGYVMGLAAPYLYLLVVRVSKYKDNVWKSFATANGWLLDTKTSVLELVPLSLQFGHSQDYSPIIRAQLGQTACDLFSYHTTVGEGRDSHTYHYTIARVPLPQTLPHLLLLSKQVHWAKLQRDMVNSQTLRLEGDFDNYFKLQIEQGQQIDALTVITPDVMQTLVRYNQAEDIEIIGQDLYFIVRADHRDVRHIQPLIQSAAELSQQIIQNVTLEHGPLGTGASLVVPSVEPPAPNPNLV